jgi:hypothetical protein
VTRPGRMRRRLARWLDPTVADPTTSGSPQAAPSVQAPPRPADPWPELCEQFALRILGVAYQSAGQLAEVEREEEDPGRLERLYRVDHATSRIRRQAENLLVLAGRTVEDAGRQITPILDVIRAANSAIDHYSRVRIGAVVHLAVVDLAADDVIRVLTEVLDNATRFSSPASIVTVSAHLTELGSVLLRVEDSGIGMSPDLIAEYNAALGGQARMTGDGTNTSQLGLQVVHRLARAHQMHVQLIRRDGVGTTTTVLLPTAMLCEIPVAGLPRGVQQATSVPRVGPQPAIGSHGMPTPVGVPRNAAPTTGVSRGAAQPAVGSVRRQPQPSRGTASTPAIHLSLVGREATGPHATGPQATGPHATGPQATGPHATGPQATGPRAAGARSSGQHAAGPREAGTTQDPLGVHKTPGRPDLPQRQPSSLRDFPRPELPPTPAPASDQTAWPDETMDFAAGFNEGQQPLSGSRSEGQ